jgi:hypothetical protein
LGYPNPAENQPQRVWYHCSNKQHTQGCNCTNEIALLFFFFVTETEFSGFFNRRDDREIVWISQQQQQMWFNAQKYSTVLSFTEKSVSHKWWVAGNSRLIKEVVVLSCCWCWYCFCKQAASMRDLDLWILQAAAKCCGSSYTHVCFGLEKPFFQCQKEHQLV